MKFIYYHVTLIKENFINFAVNMYNMDGQYNVYNIRSYNTYQQLQQQEMSVGEATKIVLGELLKYLGEVGIDIDPKYRIVKTGDGGIEARITDRESIAISAKISNTLAEAIGGIVDKYVPISNLGKLVSDALKGTRVTVVVGENPAIHIIYNPAIHTTYNNKNTNQ